MKLELKDLIMHRRIRDIEICIMIDWICRKGIENMLPNLKQINSYPGLRNMFGSFFTNMICWKGNENIDRT